MCNGCVFRAYTLGGLGFDSYAVGWNVEQFGHTRADLVRVRSDLRRGENQRRVYVSDLKSRRCHTSKGLGQKYRRVGAFPSRIRRRKQSADIGPGNGAEQRVRNGVKQNITVRMSTESFWMGNLHSSDSEGNARFEFV